MSICDKCVHREVCCDEGMGEEALNFCAHLLEERPKGKWIEVDVSNCHATLKCSVCDRVIEPVFTFGEYSYEDIKTFYPYCHCGADMR